MINGIWTPSQRAWLDVSPDYLNARDPINRRCPGDKLVLDRHDCGVIDANNDGIMDLYCLIGANRGEGEGYNELYLTNKNGGLYKVPRHALQRFRGARTR